MAVAAVDDAASLKGLAQGDRHGASSRRPRSASQVPRSHSDADDVVVLDNLFHPGLTTTASDTEVQNPTITGDLRIHDSCESPVGSATTDKHGR